MRKQRTLRDSASIAGPTISSEAPCLMTLKPAPENAGIVFWRQDLKASVPVGPSFVKNHESSKWTCLEANGARVECTEHILAAVRGMGIDNLIISLSAPAVPLLDGSASDFVRMIQEVGTVDQGADAQSILIRPEIAEERMVDFRTGNPVLNRSLLLAYPGEGLTASYSLRYEGTALADQVVTFEITPEVFAREIAPARTFMTPWEIDRWGPSGSGMLSKYFCDIAPRVSDRDAFQERLPQEAARHKILDMIGDLAILGPIAGTFVGVRSGHSLNSEMVRKLWRQS
jgi:UDP-3-O-[3-hydroxymyristoyl] N-acetylglucosamine deacetylase